MPRKKKDNPEMLPAVVNKTSSLNYADNVTFLPVMQETRGGQRNEPAQYALPKGNYSKQYVIALLKTLLSQIHQLRLSPQHLQMTLQHSIQKLLVDIEMEDFKTSGVKHEPKTKTRLS